MKNYKYITIMQLNDELFGEKPVFRIFNNKSLAKQESPLDGQIGIISYYKPWREYVFSSKLECVFNNSCLRDVLDFIDNEIPK